MHCFRVGGCDGAALGLHYSLAVMVVVVVVQVVGAAHSPHYFRAAVVYVAARPAP